MLRGGAVEVRCCGLSLTSSTCSHKLRPCPSALCFFLLSGPQICTHYRIGDRVLPDGYMPASLEQLANGEAGGRRCPPVLLGCL